MQKKLHIRFMEDNDWPHVSEIYRQGILTGNATFENDVPSWQHWDSHHIKTGRLVALFNDVIAGFTALSAVSSRSVYAGVAEVSIYIAPDLRGTGIGNKLMELLIAESEENGIWTLQASIFPENVPSIHLHEKYGFRLVGYREKIGKMNGIWRNTVIFERRSTKTGNE